MGLGQDLPLFVHESDRGLTVGSVIRYLAPNGEEITANIIGIEWTKDGCRYIMPEYFGDVITDDDIIRVHHIH